MYTSKSIGGARIDRISAEVGKLENSKERHVVVLVGTNDVNREGSIVLREKYRRLIEKCKEKRNRHVTLIGIPTRFDVNNTQNSRRLGVNLMLSVLCKDLGVSYFDFECKRSRLWKDGLHLNSVGQDELARKIFFTL